MWAALLFSRRSSWLPSAFEFFERTQSHHEWYAAELGPLQLDPSVRDLHASLLIRRARAAAAAAAAATNVEKLLTDGRCGACGRGGGAAGRPGGRPSPPA